MTGRSLGWAPARAVAAWTIAVAVAACALLAPGDAAAQARAETADDLRAAALVGLARVARDGGDPTAADRHFLAADRLRPLDAATRLEHFWVLADVDAERAIATARALADVSQADEAVVDRWMALLAERDDTTALAAAVRRAGQTLPPRARWPRALGDRLLRVNRPERAAAAFAEAASAEDGTTADRAMQALALERAGDATGAAAAWDDVPDAAGRRRPDWWAAALRTRAARDGRPAVLADVLAYVEAYPAETAMRSLAVEALAEAGRPAEALELLSRIAPGDRDAAMLRREAQLSLTVGQPQRAAHALGVLERRRAATTPERWHLAELRAPAASATETIGRLEALRTADTGCHDRALVVADLAAIDEVAAAVAGARPDTCPLPARLALPAARWLVAQANPLQAIALLQRAVETTPTDEALALALVERHLAANDPSAARDVMHAHFTARDDEEQSGMAAAWAGLALAAGADAEAARLARAALGSSRDVEARHVLASLAQRQGDPRAAYDWLSPVADALATDIQLATWLDALAELQGPAAALAEGRRRWRGVAVAVDTPAVEIASRLARWAAAAGDAAAADALELQVRAVDPRRADRLHLERQIAEGKAAGVTDRLGDRPLASLETDDLRLLVTAALDSGRWGTADEAIAEWRRREPASAWASLKAAELALGRDGRLTDTLRAALLDLAAGHPAGVLEAHIRLAQDATARADYAEATRWLGGATPTDPLLPMATRRVLVQLLAAQGQWHDVLTALAGGSEWPADLDAVKARALVALDRGAEAHRVLTGIAPQRRAAGDWRLLADLTAAGPLRLAVLEAGLDSVPAAQQAPLLSALAALQRQLGRPDEARRIAGRALALDPRSLEAWQVRLAIHPGSDEERLADMVAAAAVVGQRPDAALDLADAALAAGAPGTEEASLLGSWVADGLAVDPDRALRLVARLAITTGDWPQALDAVARARARSPQDRGLQHLAAQLHAWSGNHPVAAELFASYLHAVPDDASAWREYGRLLSWMQRPGAAGAAYAAAARLAPTAALQAETRTKAAMARLAWRAAAAAAADWEAREPESLDARMDRAVALDRAGDVGAAARLFDDLATARSLPRDLRESARRYTLTHRPEGRLVWRTDTAEGFGGQQRLAQRVAEATVGDRVGAGGSSRLAATAGRGVVDADAATWDVTTLRADGEVRLHRNWQATGMLGVTWLAAGVPGGGASSASPDPGRADAAATGEGALWSLRGDLTRAVGDGLRIGAFVERRPFWENGATVAARLQAAGGGAQAEWRPAAAWLVQARAVGHGLGDGNRRQEVGGSVAWRTSRGDADVEVRSSAFRFGYRDRSVRYFSPASFTRTDVEAEVRQWFGRPRAEGDRRGYVAGGGGVGVDGRGARYGLGLATLRLPVGRRWAVVAEGRWVRASVYQSSRVGAWIEVGR